MVKKDVDGGFRKGECGFMRKKKGGSISQVMDVSCRVWMLPYNSRSWNGKKGIVSGVSGFMLKHNVLCFHHSSKRGGPAANFHSFILPLPLIFHIQ